MRAIKIIGYFGSAILAGISFDIMRENFIVGLIGFVIGCVCGLFLVLKDENAIFFKRKKK